MRIPVAQIVLSFCFYLSLVRGTNISLFYPADESQLASIDYTLQTLMNITLLLGMVAYFFIINNYAFFIKVLSRGFVPLIVLGALVSLAFSTDKMQSLKFVVAVAAISLPSILYLHANGVEKLIRAFGHFVVAMAFTNLAYIILLPQYGIMEGAHMGRWRGLMEHKNIFGPFFAIGFYILLHQLRLKNPLNLVLQIIAMIISFLFVVKAESSTGLIMFIGMGFFYPAMLFLYRFRSAWERSAILLVILSFMLFLFTVAGQAISSEFFALTGKDSTLTGRTGIWKVLYELIAQKPLVGYGPGMSERPEFMQRIQAEVGWDAKGTHNSYLDLLINYGYPETILMVFLILKIWLGSFLTRIETKSFLRNQALASSFVFIILTISFANASALFSRSIFSLFMVVGLSVLAAQRQMEHRNAGAA